MTQSVEIRMEFGCTHCSECGRKISAWRLTGPGVPVRQRGKGYGRNHLQICSRVGELPDFGKSAS